MKKNHQLTTFTAATPALTKPSKERQVELVSGMYRLSLLDCLQTWHHG